MTKTQLLQKQLNSLWTVAQLAKRARKSRQTIHLWREHRGLPTIVIDGDRRDALRFVPSDVRKWARANKIVLH